MKARRARILALWLASVAAAVGVVAHARYITDLSAFLPAKPTPLQQLLVDQLRDGPASRLILIALEDGDPKDRAQISTAMVHRLRNDAEFSSVDNGEPLAAERDRDFLFQHRYLLSNAVTAQRFSAAGLKAAIEETIQDLASSTGLMLKSLVPHDPTGETLRIIDQLTRTQGPQTQDGVWVSADGARALMIAQTAAPGSDTDAQERALETIRGAFRSSLGSAGSGAAATHLRLSGPGVFAVAARAKIKRAALRLSIVSSILVIGVLLAVYRSIAALVLGLLPVATGALLGIAAVALVFGVVHGITLGFGITLIGESVDYSIYFFIQSLRREAGSASESWQRLLWPTIRLGMLTSVCGFASLLPSGFPGLAQLGLYSISGLIAAALVTRFVLPELLPHGFKIRDVAPLGLRMGRLRDSMRGRGGFAIGGTACAIAVIAFAVLYRHHDTLWNRELSRLSPMSVEDLRYDAKLRADLGAADVLDIVIVGGPTLEAVLRGAESAGSTLQTLIDAGIIGEFDTPANYLPSLATQQARRSALPDPQVLHDHLQLALAGLDLGADQLAPFIADVEARSQWAACVSARLLAGAFAVAWESENHELVGALVEYHSARGTFSTDLPADGGIEFSRVATAPAPMVDADELAMVAGGPSAGPGRSLTRLGPLPPLQMDPTGGPLLAEYRERLTEAREQADDIMARARKAADTAESEAKAEGNAKRDELVAAATRDIEAETRRSLQQIRKEVADLTVLATEKVTRKSLDADDQRRLVEDALSEVDFTSLSGSESSN